MKVLSYILMVFVLVLTARPLLNNALHHQEINMEMHCTGCDDQPGDDHRMDHDCCQDCHCALCGFTVFQLSVSPEIKVYEHIIRQDKTYSVIYHFNLKSPVWRPPQV